MRTSHSSTNTTPYRAVTAERTTWTTCNWYTGGATMRTMRGPGTGRQRLEPDDEQSSRPVLRGLGLGNEARLPDNSGALEGSGTSVMLSGTTSFLAECQPAWPTRTRACAPGVTACEISFRCKVMPAVVQRGRTRPTPLPWAGQMAPKM